MCECVYVQNRDLETQNREPRDLEQRTQSGDLKSGDLKTTEYTLASLIAMKRFQTTEYKLNFHALRPENFH